jgi:DtxR family manganese transport transcriptional regulator
MLSNGVFLTRGMTRPSHGHVRRPSPLERNPRRTRQEHSEETAQDYVEMIAELIETTGEARVIDLARRLGVTHVTVSRTLQRLRRV